MTTTPPVAARLATERTFHNDVVIDQYEWLRDKENPDVIAHLTAENAYTEAMTADLGPLKDSILAEIKARTQQTDLSVPRLATHSDGTSYWYYARTIEGKNYAISCRVKATDSTIPDVTEAITGEEILLDGNAEAAGQDFFSLGGMSISPNGTLMAWLVDNAGDERFTLKIKDLTTGELLSDTCSDLTPGLAWAGNDWLFYGRVDEAWRPYQVWRHHIGTDSATDQLVLQEDDDRFWLGFYESKDRSQLIFHAGSKLTGEARILATTDPTGVPRLIAERREGVDYTVTFGGDRLYILHNATCTDYELAECGLAEGDPTTWHTVIPGTAGVRLSEIDAYQNFLVLESRKDGLPHIRVLSRDADGEIWLDRDVEFDEPLYEVFSTGASNYDAHSIRLTYTSFLTPVSVFELELGTGERQLLKRTAVLDDPKRGAFNPSDYVMKREWATAADGTQIPLSIVHRADLDLDGANPTLLYGYGSYEVCIPVTFSISRLALIERGFVYAIAHIRGGGEMGRSWYDNGKMLTKKNTFSDFVDAAGHLIDVGYTCPEKLAAEGRSAGGLLMGAITNLAPERFRAIHAGVPFVDALTSILKPELPLTVTEWEEWGDPFHDPEVYEYMKTYTPYENIRQGVSYPAILATTSLNDTRVLYVEPAKWVARLRETVADTPGRNILLHTDMTSGHGGASGRYGAWEQAAFELAWICRELGVTA
ncbi:MAG: S9 family peptidase [Propionibacteriaceae bacterium]